MFDPRAAEHTHTQRPGGKGLKPLIAGHAILLCWPRCGRQLSPSKFAIAKHAEYKHSSLAAELVYISIGHSALLALVPILARAAGETLRSCLSPLYTANHCFKKRSLPWTLLGERIYRG